MPDTVGQFQLLESLGAGTLGELHRARDLDRGRTIALRLVGSEIRDDPSRLAALLSDARRVAELSHPAIAAVYDCGQNDGVAFIASEFVPGQQLPAMVSGSPLHPRRALELAMQIADGLAAAHAQDLRHDALTGGSVRITPKGAAKVLDVGMFAWTAAHSRTPLDDRVGLGAVLFEMLTGRPIRPGWPAEFRTKEIPPGVQPVLQKLTSSDPREQYASMVVASAALRDAMLTVATSIDEWAKTPAPAVATQADRLPWRPGAIAALALALVGTIVWWLTY